MATVATAARVGPVNKQATSGAVDIELMILFSTSTPAPESLLHRRASCTGRKVSSPHPFVIDCG